MGGRIRKIVASAGRAIGGLKTWQYILILIPLLFVLATCLRFDHLRMAALRDEVLAADEEGDDEKIAAAMQELKNFTFHHTVINIVEKNGVQRITFGTGPFYLEQSYIRDATAALEEAENNLGSDDNPNGNVFAAAMAVCKPQAIKNGWAWNSEGYLSCMTGEINKYPEAEQLTTEAKLPSTALYRYDFSSPLWAPSLSGLVMILTGVVILIIFIRVLIWCTLKIALIFVK